MARRGRRYRRHRRGLLPKTTGGWLGFTFKILGAVAAAGPAISAVTKDITGGYPQNIPQDIIGSYTGWNPNFTGGSPGTSINVNQLGVGVGSIAVGVLMIKLGSYLRKVVH